MQRMDKIKMSDIELDYYLVSMVNNNVNSKRLQNEIKKWLYQQKLQFNQNTLFNINTLITELGKTLEIKINGKYLMYHTIKLVNPKNKKYSQCIILENNTVKIKMLFDSFYPFNPPKNIYINDFNYLSLLKCKREDLKVLHINKQCLCCDSFLCKNNWGPTLNIFKIIKEIQQNLKIKRAIIDRIFCNCLKRKYLIDDIPLFNYLFTN